MSKLRSFFLISKNNLTKLKIDLLIGLKNQEVAYVCMCMRTSLLILVYTHTHTHNHLRAHMSVRVYTKIND